MTGICNLALVPVRIEASDRSEMVTQMLFGQVYKVLQQDGSWCKIRMDEDGYEGFICSKQLHELRKDAQMECGGLASRELTIKTPEGETTIIPRGSKLWNFKDNQFGWGGEHFEVIGNLKQDILASEDLTDVVQYSRSMLRVPYLWGGKSFFGIDCSGFTQLVFSLCGVSLKRDASQQALEGRTVATLNDSQTGDLVFFDNPEGRVTHVGIVLRETNKLKVIHASGKVRIDLLQDAGIFNEETGARTHHFHSIRRFIA